MAAEPADDVYGPDIYTEPDGDPGHARQPRAPRADGRHLGGRPRGRRAPGRRGHRARHVRRALRAPAHRPPDQRPPALLRAPLPHPHRQARRGRDVPRPGRLLAVGAGDRHRHPDARHPPGPGAAGRRAPPRRTPPSSRSRAAVGVRGLRHPVQPVPRPELPHRQLPDARDRPPGRHLELRGGRACSTSRAGTSRSPTSTATPSGGWPPRSPIPWPRTSCPTGSLGIGSLRSEGRTLP